MRERKKKGRGAGLRKNRELSEYIQREKLDKRYKRKRRWGRKRDEDRTKEIEEEERQQK